MGGDMEFSALDTIFAVGTALFMISGIPQVVKLHRVKFSDAQSLTHNEMHLLALCTMLTGYILMLAPMSITITLFELGLRIYLISLIRKKRSHPLHGKSDLLYYMKQGGKKLVKIISRTSAK
jgi:uncharacterized membrane protein